MKRLTSIKPTGLEAYLSASTTMDYASLYQSTMYMRFPSKQNIRKIKIKKIFSL